MQKLRVSFGDMPEPLTIIQLPQSRRANSGQLWQVMRIRGRTLHCMVLPDGHDLTKEPPGTVLWCWRWDSPNRKGKR